MSNDITKLSLNDQLKHWRQRVEDLGNWLQSHELSHPDWEQNNRDRNTALWKIEQLEDREYRVPKDISETYSIPSSLKR